MKKKRISLIKEYAANNPDFQSGRKIVYNLLIILVTLRIIDFILVIIHSIINGNYLRPFDIFIKIIQVLVSFYFAIMIYSAGIKLFVYLALIGGIYSLFMAFQNKVIYEFGNDDILDLFDNPKI